MEKFSKFLRCLTCDIVSPCAERNHQLACFVKRHVSVHHGTDSKSTYACKLHTVFTQNIFCHILIAGLETFPDFLQAVCPDTIHILILPSVTAGCDGLVLIINQNCLDPCGTELDSKCCTVLKNRCFCLIYSHCKKSSRIIC